jgi:hypothetical protein
MAEMAIMPTTVAIAMKVGTKTSAGWRSPGRCSPGMYRRVRTIL